jgi:hypothetical protein
MSREGDDHRFHEDGFPGLLSPPPSQGSPSAAAASAAPLGGGDPNNVPRARRGATTVANAVAFFARKDTFVRWRGGGCGDNGGGDVLALAACKSRQWTVWREREGGGGGCSNEVVAMLPRGGRAVDKTMRGVGAEGAARGELEGRRTTRREGGGEQREASGVHDVVGSGVNDSGGDSGGGSWSSEVGRAPQSMPGTAAPATVPAPGGVDDANDAPMAIGGRRQQGWGGATTATTEQPPIGRGGRQ